MRQLSIVTLFCFLSLSALSYAQQPIKPSAVDIYADIQKLNFLGSALYIAAHPDDENTRLIAYLANEKKARTGYLSLTRGDGGQNLIGTELRELLGVIRTQELLEARKIDGGKQFFTRANDFGYSKSPDETLTIWDRDTVLSDMVYIIRKFRPDVIVNRFDHRTPGTTHGHHTSSAMLSQLAFDLAPDPTKYAEQLSLVSTWKPTRLFFNTSYWMYGGKDKFEKADKSKFHNVNTGVYYPMLGKSNQEIAALSRSRHRSQGFGSTGTRGNDLDYLELIMGSTPTERANLFEGIDTTWSRVQGGETIKSLLTSVQNHFDFKNPAASIPDLLRAMQMIHDIDDLHWRQLKLREISDIIISCAGLYIEAAATSPYATRESVIPVRLEAINRSSALVALQSVTMLPQGLKIDQQVALENNKAFETDVNVNIPTDIKFTEPYWLRERGTEGMYNVSDHSLIGTPDVIREMKVAFNLTVNGVPLTIERDVIYKYNDAVKGEVYTPFTIVPDVTMSVSDKVIIFPGTKTKKIAITVKAWRNAAAGTLRVDTPENWKVVPASVPFSIARKGYTQTLEFEVTPPADADDISAKVVATIAGQHFDNEQIIIDYNHIPQQQVLKPAESRLIKLNIKTGSQNIGYIMGAGDEVDKSLIQMGYNVQPLLPSEITKEKLSEFDVIITGIRAYNTVQELAVKQSLLLEFVKNGKTMIVQYNTMGDFVTKDFSPFPLKISRDRVTDEKAPVRFLAPDHPVLNYPNKITADDFKNWKQEQGLYYPNEWDSAFTPILSSNDPGENPKNGALLIAKYGKGYYIYTGLSFFRELPEGVPGAFRLMSNMISIGN